jgi:hypothetical protein
MSTTGWLLPIEIKIHLRGVSPFKNTTWMFLVQQQVLLFRRSTLHLFHWHHTVTRLKAYHLFRFIRFCAVECSISCWVNSQLPVTGVVAIPHAAVQPSK